VLYNNDELTAAISRALTDEGVFVAQVGQAEFLVDPAIEYTRESVLDDSFIPHLLRHGFMKIREYEDFHGGFMGIWNFMIAFKDTGSSENWYASQSQIDLEIRKRLIPTRSGESPLRYFDGATMKGLSHPSRSAEEVFCRKADSPPFCDMGHGYDPERHNIPSDALEVKASGVALKEAAPEGSYVAIDDAVRSMSVLPHTRRLTKIMGGISDKWKTFESYPFRQGYATDYFGYPAHGADSVVTAFANSGCNGTDNIRSPPQPRGASSLDGYANNIYIDRNYHHLFSTRSVSKDVSAGEELLDGDGTYYPSDDIHTGVVC